MIDIIMMFLVVAILQPATPTIVTTFSPERPTIVTTFQQPVIQGITLKQPVIEGIPLEPAQPTIVKTWKLN